MMLAARCDVAVCAARLRNGSLGPGGSVGMVRRLGMPGMHRLSNSTHRLSQIRTIGNSMDRRTLGASRILCSTESSPDPTQPSFQSRFQYLGTLLGTTSVQSTQNSSTLLDPHLRTAEKCILLPRSKSMAGCVAIAEANGQEAQRTGD